MPITGRLFVGRQPSTMSDDTDSALYERTRQLLEPGDIDLLGLVVHTDLTGEAESEMHRLTVDVGEVIARHAGQDPSDTYVYSGTDDTEFGLNQHQGLTIEDDSFVWECQQLLRDGSYDIVFYYEASVDQEAILEEVEEMGYETVGIRPD